MHEGIPLPSNTQIPVQNSGLNYQGTNIPFISPSSSPTSSLSQSPTSASTTPLPESRPPSRACNTGTRIRPNALPHPTYHPPDPTKKSHARKQPAGHVPRPRNPFILFRCDFVRQKKVPANVEKDHRNISRIVGSVWREMSEQQKEPWVQMAEREKQIHAEVYPGYRYTPGIVPLVKPGRKKVKDGDDIARTDGDSVEAGTGRKMKEDELAMVQGQDIRSARRSSSCPPVQAMSPGPRSAATRVPPFPSYPVRRSSGKRRPYPPTADRPYDLLNSKHRADLMRRVRGGGPQRVVAPSPVLHGPSAAARGTAMIPDDTSTTSSTISNPANAHSLPPSHVYQNQPQMNAQTYNQNPNYTQDQNLINALPFRRRSSSWPPRTTRIVQAAAHDGASRGSPTTSLPPNSSISATSGSELNSPPPPISGNPKTRRAFARDLDLDPPPFVPVLHGGPYAIAPPGDAPGWDCAPALPMSWEEWVGAGGRADWEGWEGMDVDDQTGVFDIPNDMNFPAAEISGYSSAAVSGAHAAVFSDTQVTATVPVQPSTPKLQPIISQRAHTQPVFTNPFASHPTPPPCEAEAAALSGDGAFSNPNNNVSSVVFAPSDLAIFGDHQHPTTQMYSDSGGALHEGQHGDLGAAGGMNIPHSSVDSRRKNLYSDVDEDEFEGEEDGDGDRGGNEELDIGSMFPRMSLDANADAEGEDEDEGEDESEDMPTERG